MPDWSYHTIFKPLLFRLPPETARDCTLQAMKLVSRLPFGSKMIEWLGHMSPSSRLQTEFFGVRFTSPVDLGAGVDVHLTGLQPLAKFGFGFIEIGPVTVEPVVSNENISRENHTETISYAHPLVNDGVERHSEKLFKELPVHIPIGVRISHLSTLPEEATIEKIQLLKKLQGMTDFFLIDTLFTEEWTEADLREHLHSLKQHAKNSAVSTPLLLQLAADTPIERIDILVHTALAEGLDGLLISDGIRDDTGQYLVSKQNKQDALDILSHIRGKYGNDLTIIVSAGIHEPQDALEAIEAGANLLQITSGLIFSGPGLPKRINEALLWQRQQTHPPYVEDKGQKGWLALALFGLGIITGGILAVWFALTSVILPYDEAFLKMSRARLSLINEHLLDFMSHDRLSLAGTMISSGILYCQLAYFGVKNGLHWARQAILVAGLVGFAGIFGFLGYGYFDPLHALFFLLLLPPFILGIIRSTNARESDVSKNLINDKRWKLSQWGQLMFVMLGAALTTAGIVITFIGMSTVFVPEDLAFMGVTREELSEVSDRLIPLIAHDRAGFGSALVSNGLLLLLLSLWGFREGRRWVWYTLLFSGLPGFIAGFGAHVIIGYNDLWHLSPAFLAVALYILGLCFSYPYLCKENLVDAKPVAQAEP